MSSQKTPENASSDQDFYADYPDENDREPSRSMPAPTPPAPPPDDIDEQLAAIADFFDGLTTGVSVMVSRLEPEWCSGYLEEREIIEGQEPIDINYLIKSWGGKRLRCRVRSKRGGNRGQWLRSIDIPLQTWEPLRRGVRIYPRDTTIDEDETWTTRKPSSSQQEKTRFGELGEMMALMASMRQSELATLQALGLGGRPSHAGNNSDRSVSTAIELAKTFAQLQQRPTNDEEAGLELFGKALDLLKPTPASSTPAIVSRSQQAPSLSDALSRLPPEKAVATLQEAMAKMTPDRQQSAMSSLLRALEGAGMIEDDDTDTETEPAGDIDTD
jgi:hypothetical protein